MNARDLVTDQERRPSPSSTGKLDELARQQGVGPAKMQQIIALADFWPEDEDPEEFRRAVNEWRSEGEAGVES